MRLLLSGILFVLALAFTVVSLPALFRGGRAPERTTLAEVARAEAPSAQDLEIEGVLVRSATAGNLRADGRYLLPLVSEPDARAVLDSGRVPPLAGSRRYQAVIAELDLEAIAGKSLQWDETTMGTAWLGAFTLSGLVKSPDSWSPAAALHLEATTGFTPSQVLCIRAGRNSFERPAAATGVAMGLGFAALGWMLLRARARARALRNPEPATGGFAWGGTAAAVVGLAVAGARLADNAGRAVVTHGDEASRALARAADAGTAAAKATAEDPTLEGVLRIVDGAETANTVLEVAELLRGPEPVRATVQILGGIEKYRRGPEGAYHLTTAEVRRSWSRGAGASELRVASPRKLTPRRELGEQVWIIFEEMHAAPLLARVSDTYATLQAEPVPQEFTLELDLVRGKRDDVTTAGKVDLVVAQASVASFAERTAKQLRAALERRMGGGKAGVTVEVVPVAAFPAHFHLRGEDLEIEVGALRLDVVLRPGSARLR